MKVKCFILWIVLMLPMCGGAVFAGGAGGVNAVEEQELAIEPQKDAGNVVAADNGFIAGLWLTHDKKQLEKWEKSGLPETIPVVDSIDRGTSAYAVFCFNNQKKDKKKRSHILCDVTVFKPDGTVFVEHKNKTVLKDKRAVKQSGARVGSYSVPIEIGDEAPSGRYAVQAVVTDVVAKTSVTLRYPFTVAQFAPLADYDFSSDYRITMQERARKKAAEEKNKLLTALKPIHGVSVERWAVINARMLHGDDLKAILKKEKIKKASWEKADKKWNEKMAKEDGINVRLAYSMCFYGAGIGRYPEAGRDLALALSANTKLKGEAPMPRNEWFEISRVVQASIEKGDDYDAVLQKQNINPYDWIIADTWWKRALAERSE